MQLPLPVLGWIATQVAAPGSTHDAATAERAARAYLAAHAELAPGASASDFVVAENRIDGEIRTIGFRQTWRGLPVIGGQIGFLFARDRLFAVSAHAVPIAH